MPATEAQVRANQANSAKSTGPKTPEGKEASRANAYKHGMTATTLMPEREAAEVSRRYTAFAGELRPSGEVGRSLVLLAARSSIRMELCADRDNAMATERVRKAMAEIEYPEGVDQAGTDRLRNEANDRAMFDTSPEATLARKYEAAAERSFLRALKELRVVEKQAKAAEDEMIEEKLASFSPAKMTDDEFDQMCAEGTPPTSRKTARRVESDAYAELKARLGLPIAAGKRR
jgi:hypothetical protein